MGLETFIKNVFNERERRYNDPAFKAELAREKAELIKSLNGMGSKGLEAAFTGILKAPLTGIGRALQTVGGQKSFGDGLLDTLKEFGKAGWQATQCASLALYSVGKGVKLGLRHLTAK